MTDIQTIQSLSQAHILDTIKQSTKQRIKPVTLRKRLAADLGVAETAENHREIDAQIKAFMSLTMQAKRVRNSQGVEVICLRSKKEVADATARYIARTSVEQTIAETVRKLVGMENTQLILAETSEKSYWFFGHGEWKYGIRAAQDGVRFEAVFCYKGREVVTHEFTACNQAVRAIEAMREANIQIAAMQGGY